MPQRKVKTTYTKARKSPGERLRKKQTLEEFHADFIPPLHTPKGLSPLAQYVIENEESGLSVEELIWQFQEYDCEHPQKMKVITGHKEISTCLECGLIEVKAVR